METTTIKPVSSSDLSHGKRHDLLTRTVGLSAVSVLSPLAGLLAEAAMAWRFGAAPVVDAYRVTFLVIFFGQQLFVISVLPFVVVPIWAEAKSHGNEGAAWAMVNSLFRLLLAIGILISLFLFLFPDLAVNVAGPGLEGEGRTSAVFLIRWCGLAFIPAAWSGIACGVLYAHDIFWVATIAQLLTNSALVLAIVVLGSLLAPSTTLAAGTLGGAVISTGLYASTMARQRKRQDSGVHGRQVDLGGARKALRLAAPLVGGLVVGLISGLITARALSRLPTGSLAVFGYASRMSNIVLLAPNALALVLFPKLADDWHSKTSQEFVAGCKKAVRAALYIALPLACTAAALRRPITAVLLRHGAFSGASAASAASLFGLLVLSAPACAASTFLSRFFYARMQTLLPTLISVAGNFLMSVLVPIVAAKSGVIGVAIVLAFTPWIMCALLIGAFQYPHGNSLLFDMSGYAARVTVIAAVAAWLGARLAEFCTGLLPSGILASAVGIGSGVLLAIMLFFFATLMFHFSEALTCRWHLGRYASLHSGLLKF